MKKLLISILALICVGLHAQNAAITSGNNLVVSDGKMVVYDLTDTIANFGTSTQSGAIDQITTIFNITPGYNVYVDWNDGDGGHLIVADGTDKSMTSNFTVSDTTYHIYVYGDLEGFTKIYINAEATYDSLFSSEFSGMSLTYFGLYNSGTNHEINSSDFAGMPLAYFGLYNSGTNNEINPSDFAGMPLTYFWLNNSGTNHAGQISYFATGLNTLYIGNSGTGISITSGTMKTWANCNITLKGYTGGAGGDCDAFLIAYAATAGAGVKTIDLSNAARTSASDAAVTTLIGLGKTIKTLGLTEP